MPGHRSLYTVLYRVGVRPWEIDPTPPELADYAGPAPAPNRDLALDLGCGSGKHAVYVASRGWRVVGIDFVPQAVARATAAARTANVRARFLVGDVTRLSEYDLGGPFDLVYDVKCFHSLRAADRPAYAGGVASVCRAGGTFLLFALEPSRLRGLFGPAGVSRATIETLFRQDFELVSARPARGGPFEPAYYELRRRPC
jgi:SAM-dependent methyltransferase